MLDIKVIKVKVMMFVKGLDLSNNVFEYEVNRLTNETFINENDATRPKNPTTLPPCGFHQFISRNLSLKNPAKND